MNSYILYGHTYIHIFALTKVAAVILCAYICIYAAHFFLDNLNRKMLWHKSFSHSSANRSKCRTIQLYVHTYSCICDSMCLYTCWYSNGGALLNYGDMLPCNAWESHQQPFQLLLFVAIKYDYCAFC